jgi:hypothetical protein
MLSQGLLHPSKINKILFMGVPSKNEVYRETLRSFDPKKIIIIQNSLDPMLDFFQVETFFKSINKDIELIEIEAKGHDYAYSELIYDILHG